MENLLFQEKFDLVTNLLLSVAVQNENKNALYKAQGVHFTIHPPEARRKKHVLG